MEEDEGKKKKNIEYFKSERRRRRNPQFGLLMKIWVTKVPWLFSVIVFHSAVWNQFETVRKRSKLGVRPVQQFFTFGTNQTSKKRQIFSSSVSDFMILTSVFFLLSVCGPTSLLYGTAWTRPGFWIRWFWCSTVMKDLLQRKSVSFSHRTKCLFPAAAFRIFPETSKKRETVSRRLVIVRLVTRSALISVDDGGCLRLRLKRCRND